MKQHEIEKKWQEYWKRNGTFEYDAEENPCYILTMFPYPSGERLHIGHWFQYGVMDSWAKYRRLQGHRVFQPMGFDAFGLPAENHAISHKVHPKESTRNNIDYMRSQFEAMGVGYSWKHGLETSDPRYYRWTQWLFLQLYRKGLAYQKTAPVNWCPGCRTVLANEQVVDGLCERCDTPVFRKMMKQWFFRITAYAEELHAALDDLDWPDSTKTVQKNWIGRSEGCRVVFPLEGSQDISVFTTRVDTLYGVTYIALAPEHPGLIDMCTEEQREAVRQYCDRAAAVPEVERSGRNRDKTGAFTGRFCRHPLTGEEIPVWTADYVIEGYGSSAVMGVPGHDRRDFDFAVRYVLPVKTVVVPNGNGDACVPGNAVFSGEGRLVYSGSFSGLSTVKARSAIAAELETRGSGGSAVEYRLRDWLISRQRYWGAPIPVVHCPSCGIVPLPEEELPVILPDDVDFRPDGRSPLADCDGFIRTVCPVCGGAAEREADTMDTFVCSSWYFLRFFTPDDEDRAFATSGINRVRPVDIYCGGREHACLHLLYARFITKVLRDMGFLDFGEPFLRLEHQGMILGEDGVKMSKSRGAVSPDAYVEKYGADILRLYMLFGFNYASGGQWSDGGITAVRKFVGRLNMLFDTHLTFSETQSAEGTETAAAGEKLHIRELLREFHRITRIVTNDLERFMFNTAVARLMELYDRFRRTLSEVSDSAVSRVLLRRYIILLAPFLPHLAEEWWSRTGAPDSVFDQRWPEIDEALAAETEIRFAVMVDGRVRGEMCVEPGEEERVLVRKARDLPNVERFLEGKKTVRTVVVPDRVVNFVTGQE